MLESKNLSFTYGSKVSFSFPDIICQEGQSCLILGKSGVGKTTLLHLLGGLIEPKTGEIHVNGQNIHLLKGQQRDKFRGKNIGIIFQKPHFISSINIEQNLLLTQKLAGLKTDKQHIHDLLKGLQIDHRIHSKPNTLSQGELQRASVARAVLNQPKLILADEPTSALDDESCAQVVHLLEQTAADLKAALVIVTHDGRLKNSIDHQIILS